MVAQVRCPGIAFDSSRQFGQFGPHCASGTFLGQIPMSLFAIRLTGFHWWLK